jgi:hypothetical protein
MTGPIQFLTVDDVLQIHRRMIVEFGGVSTDISGRHNTFRSTRGEIKEFYRKHAIKPGRLIEIMRLSQYEYRVRPKRDDHP